MTRPGITSDHPCLGDDRDQGGAFTRGITFVEPAEALAAAAFLPTPFAEAAVLVLDPFFYCGRAN